MYNETLFLWNFPRNIFPKEPLIIKCPMVGLSDVYKHAFGTLLELKGCG